MASLCRHCPRAAPAPLLTARPLTLPPQFLLPSLSTTTQRPFSASAPAQKRQRKDGNKDRGISALYSRGQKRVQAKVSVKLSELPRPLAAKDIAPPDNIVRDHGLYRFFRSAEASMAAPERVAEHGRAWKKAELQTKAWDDLHKLWWTCVYEKNIIATEEAERERMRAGYGEAEAEKRLAQVLDTMKNIRAVLEERWYTWEDAKELHSSGYEPKEHEQWEDTYDSGAPVGAEHYSNQSLDEAGSSIGSGETESSIEPKEAGTKKAGTAPAQDQAKDADGKDLARLPDELVPGMKSDTENQAPKDTSRPGP